MATITQQDIINILKTGTYPSTQKPLNYYQQKQPFPVYPCVEVRKVQSDSNLTDIEKTSVDQTFDISYYVQYTRPEQYEEADRLATENEILNKLENNDFIPTGIIYFESKQWNTATIDDQIFGSKSTLRFTIKDLSTTDGVGNKGSNVQIELNTNTTPLTIKVLNMDKAKGFDTTSHTIDSGNVKYDPSGLIEFGEFTITYKNTDAIEAVIDALSAAGVENQGRLIENGTPTKYVFLVGRTTTRGAYRDVEKATTRLLATGTW